jgi:ribosomal protein L11 methyltransferase
MAFGTGTHETTRMVCATLLTLPLSGWNVLDCGCGTGILGIVAMKLGANSCTAYDIDEWSVNNTRHNAVINHVDIEPILGDGSLLNSMTKSFDLIMANINRNILMADMPAMCQRMAPGAFMVLSGFYTDDIPLLITKADELGLTLTDQKENNGWACITLQKA